MSGSTIARIVVALLVVAITGWIDKVTGPRWGFSLFYLIPIVAVAWSLGTRPALVVATGAAIAWLLADVAWHDDLAPSLWNGVTRIIIYMALGTMTAGLRRDRERLRQLLAQETRTARTDLLTGLLNARAFYERSAEEVARSRRHGAPLAMVYLDLDNFKRVNDGFGHACGDRLLQEVATALRASLRASDVAARLGGDEFAVLLIEVERPGAEIIAARLVVAITALATQYPGTELGASIGVAWFASPPADVEAMVQAGDKAMYRAKTGGKGRAVVEDHSSAS